MHLRWNRPPERPLDSVFLVWGRHWLRWTAQLAMGAVVSVLLTAGVAGASLPLSGLVVGSPGDGAVFTAEGAGGSASTTVEPGVDPSSEPTHPSLYLKPVQLTSGGTQPAYWRVWWNGSTQTKYVVALQQHVNAADAQAEAQRIDASNQTPSSVTGPQTWSYVSTFSVPSIPGAAGLVWNTTVDNANEELRFVVFARDNLVELVSVTTFSGPTSASVLDAFALAQYNHSADGGIASISPVVWIVLALVVAGVVIAMLRSRRKDGHQVSVAGYGTMIGFGYGVQSGPQGSAPYGHGAPNPYGPPPGTYGPPPTQQHAPLVGGPAPTSTSSESVLPSFGAFLTPAPSPTPSLAPASLFGDDPVSPGGYVDPSPLLEPTAPATVPAGWFPDPMPDPSRPGRQRYWDGDAWTNHYHPS